LVNFDSDNMSSAGSELLMMVHGWY
jgi:hypothetical protein